jgi:aminoglycoside phosphotransferase (APT) family kinase protein
MTTDGASASKENPAEPGSLLSDDALLADPTSLQRWFDATLGGRATELSISRLPGGSSNSVFRIERADRRYVLRRPPAVANDRTSHNIAREIELLTALADSDVPHAHLVGGTTEGRWIGGPFVVIDWVEGFTPRDPMPSPFGSDPALRRDLGDAVIDALAGIAKPEGVLARQVDRWQSQYDRIRVRELDHFEEIASWLRSNAPPPAPAGLMHGDYSFANVMVAPDAPSRIAAVVDWELTTIGDPMLDLGHLLSSWADATTGPTWAYYIDWSNGFRSRQASAERYAKVSGRSIEQLDYYMVLALFRLAILLEGSYSRFQRGQSDNPRHAAFAERVPSLIAQAARAIEHS